MEVNMTDFNLDEFFDQAEAWRDGDTRQIPGYLAERLFIDKARMPPLPGSGQTVTREQFQYREYIEREMERRWLAACFLFKINPDEPSSSEMLLNRIRQTPLPGLETTDIPPKPKKKSGRKPARDHKTVTAFLASVEQARVRLIEDEEKLATEQNRPAKKIQDTTAILSVDTNLRPIKANGNHLADSTLIARYSEWKTLKERVDKNWEKLKKLEGKRHPLLEGLARYFR